jgi:hypothetical protein
MELTPTQLAQYERDGFLIFPDLFNQGEIAVLRQEVARLSHLEAEEVVREYTGGVKSIFRVHEEDGATRSPPFRALVRTPRVLRPIRQVLGTDETYVYHTKINAKPAIEGTIWMWHQDYNSWSKDGCPQPNMATFNVMLNDTTEFSGRLYIIPGSHKLGLQESVMDTSTGYMDEDGFVYVVDRVKDMIISGGENVCSVEVENIVAQHPAVAQCAVIGIPNETWGEEVRAVVTRKPGTKVDPIDIIAFCKERIAHYKCPRSVDIRDEPLPMSGPGKILKRDLRAPFWEGRKRQVS